MVEKAQKGQALVEFGLVLTILMLVAVGGLDFAFRLQNTQLAQHYAFQAAREASIYLNDGSQSCDAFVRSHISQPSFILVEAGDWTLTLNGCPDDPSWSQVSGTTVTATITWTQDTVWWQEDTPYIGYWLTHGEAVQKDIFQ